jgi:hypothetical protein
MQKNGFLRAAFLLALFAAITYLPLAGQLGFYRDDWHVIWAGMSRGWQAIIDLHLTDRPFMGAYYSLVYVVLGNHPLAWQIYAFSLRLGGALAFLWLLRMLWPRQQLATAIAALLFVLYPGFLQMPTSSAYQCHLAGLLFGILSLCFTLRALGSVERGRRILNVLLSALFALGCYLIMEYMVGLEGVRLVLTWYFFQQRKEKNLPNQIGRLLKNWLPNMLALGVFLFWRVFLFKSARSVTNVGDLGQKYLAEPGAMSVRLVLETIKSFIQSVFLAWGVPLYKMAGNATYSDLFFSILLSLFAAALLIFIWRRQKNFPENEMDGSRDPCWTNVIWVGTICVLCTLLPVVLSNRQVQFENTFDRYTLPASIGVSIIWLGILFGLLRPAGRIWVLTLLVMASVVTHYNNAAYFRNFWDQEKQLWWQLSWRAPDLKDNTALIAMLPPDYRLGESYEIWGPANLIYHANGKELRVAGEILNRQTLFELQRQENLGRSMRRVEYIIDYKNTLLVSIPQNGSCLHIIDGSRQELSEYEDPFLRLAAAYSHPEMIRTEGTFHTPPEAVFGVEPRHDWCYYYQKVSLARQREDWPEAERLTDEVLSLGLKPEDNSEWMPFFVAFARAQRFEDANWLGAALRDDLDFQQTYCKQFEELSRSGVRIEYIISNLCPDLPNNQ